MTQTSTSVIDQSMFSLTWPIFVELMLYMMIGIADAWFLSRISDATAASVGTVLTIVELAILLYVALSQACNSVCSQRIGANDHKLVAPSFAMALLLFTLVGGALSLVLCLSAEPITHALGLTGIMQSDAAIYLAITGGGMILLAWKFALNTIAASLGHTSWNMWSAAAMNICNIGLNYGFLYGVAGLPELGVAGIAAASVVSWTVSCVILWAMLRWRLKIHLPLRKAIVHFKTLSRPMLSIAIPGTAEPMSYQLSQILITFWVVQLGQVAMATRLYVINIIFVSILWGFALASGLQIKVSHLLGASREAEASKLLYKTMKVTLFGSMLLVLIIWLFGRVFLGFFTQDEAVIALGQQIFGLAFIMEFGRMLNIVIGTNLRAAGDARYNAVVATAVIWGVGLPLCYYLTFELKLALVGVFMAIAVDEFVRGLVCLQRWRSGRWRNKSLYG